MCPYRFVARPATPTTSIDVIPASSIITIHPAIDSVRRQDREHPDIATPVRLASSGEHPAVAARSQTSTFRHQQHSTNRDDINAAAESKRSRRIPARPGIGHVSPW